MTSEPALLEGERSSVQGPGQQRVNSAGAENVELTRHGDVDSVISITTQLPFMSQCPIATHPNSVAQVQIEQQNWIDSDRAL